MNAIDLRSDTVTRPNPAMYAAMVAAPLGDDVLGDDPTVQKLEALAAEMVGKEAALFVPSGTMGNAIAVGVHCRPGDEILVERTAHNFKYEVAGTARLWGVQSLPLESPGRNGQIPVETLQASIRPEDVHQPRTSLVVLEQTHNLSGGRVLPIAYLDEVGAFCRANRLRFHIDGARLFNAAVALGGEAKEIVRGADSVTFCISKGLGAPAGSLLCGGRAFIEEGRRLRKLLGGGLRQAGVLAAAGIYALEHNIQDLKHDHAHAGALGEALGAVAGLAIRPWPVETNMVYVDFKIGGAAAAERFQATLENAGVRTLQLGASVRLVFHRDVSAASARIAVERAGEAAREALATTGLG